ncbi:MAG: MarR family transcriptional regulator [Planctomycetota bacterium]
MNKRTKSQPKQTAAGRKRIPLEQETYLELARVADLLLGECSQLFKEYDLSAPGYNVLRILRGARPGGLPCREIAARMINRDPDITRLADRLEKLGLVRRERAVEDRRVVNIHVTDAGLERIDTLDAPLTELHQRQFDHMKKEELTHLKQLLERIYERQ